MRINYFNVLFIVIMGCLFAYFVPNVFLLLGFALLLGIVGTILLVLLMKMINDQ